jgi:hypothetical protein
MFNTFDNKSIRKLVVAFGSLFDQVYVTRKNDTTGSSENIKVPITFASKEKFLRRLESNSSISDKVKTQINLPYMSFELGNIVYDRSRKRNKLRVSSSTDNTYAYKTFSETPVEVEFAIYFYSRSMEEILQITEQILPYFNPEFNLRINFNDIYKDVNVPISYRNFKLTDDYEGNMGSRRMVVGAMSFVVSSYVFAEIKSGLPSTSSTFSLTSLSQTVDDFLIDTQSIVIDENLANSFYNIPSGVLNNTLTWVESGNFSENTQVIFLREDTQEEVIRFSCPVGAQTISGSQYAELEEAIVNNRGLCGSGLVSGYFMYRMIVKNGNTTASQSFIFISIDGSTIC